MAKMFYTREEVEQRLGKTADEIKQLVANGQLREFRDGQRVMYKVDEVDALATPEIQGDRISLSDEGEGPIRLAGEDSAAGPSGTGTGSASGSLGLAGDESGPIGLADTGGGTGEINLAGESGSSIGLVPGDSADQISLDDTGPAEESKDDTVITSHGINALDDSDGELELADPLAQTQIAPDLDDQVHLDSGSSGSGLLDLTREADDTSLGAELLDEIYPGGEEGGIETQLPTQLEVPGESAGSLSGSDAEAAPLKEYVHAVQVYDPTSGAFGAMLVIPLLVLIYLGFLAASRIAGGTPPFIDFLGRGHTVWMVTGGAIGASLIVLLVGHVMSSQTGKPKTAKPKKKARKGKKEKKG